MLPLCDHARHLLSFWSTFLLVIHSILILPTLFLPQEVQHCLGDVNDVNMGYVKEPCLMVHSHVIEI